MSLLKCGVESSGKLIGFETLSNDYSDENMDEKSDTKMIPIIDIHLLNPQIQFHSEATGGSIILTMKEAYVEGKRFRKLYLDASKGEFSIHKLMKKLEFKYALGFTHCTRLLSNKMMLMLKLDCKWSSDVIF